MTDAKPKRDLLPSSRPDHFTKALDDTYERGFNFGRAAGLEKACEILRKSNLHAPELIDLLTAEKYK